jgi:phosphatidylserine/phosphatidylglycerophosphate/cardiolipin synthase-like enzyme
MFVGTSLLPTRSVGTGSPPARYWLGGRVTAGWSSPRAATDRADQRSVVIRLRGFCRRAGLRMVLLIGGTNSSILIASPYVRPEGGLHQVSALRLVHAQSEFGYAQQHW